MKNKIKTNVVLCGDAKKKLKKIKKESIHLIVTSPPYNVGKPYKNHNDLMPYQKYLGWLNEIWAESKRVLVNGGRICINVPSVTAEGSYQPLFVDIVNQMKKLGFIMRGDILWYKQNISKRTAWGSWKSPSNPCVVQPYEFILVFSKGQKKLEGDKKNIDITKEEFILFSNSFWEIKPETGKRWHPAPFPEELVYRLMKFYSYKGNIVLDMFAGTGTVGVVAIKTNREYICIDNSKEYCSDIRAEIKKLKKNLKGMKGGKK